MTTWSEEPSSPSAPEATGFRRFVLVVHTNAADGRDVEFNEWYDNAHLAEVLQVPGFRSAQRYRMVMASLEPSAAGHPYRYLALYEIEAPSAESAVAELNARRPSMTMSASMASERLSAVFERL